jgi:hypothetical protein
MNSTGGKSIFDSDSLAHSMTNFSKNAHKNDIGQVKITRNDVYVTNKRNKKKKNLPSLLDDSRVSPRPTGGQFQFISTDFAKHKKKRGGDPLAGSGYETDFTGGNGGAFNSTYEDGFPGGVFESTVDGDVALSSNFRNAGDSSIVEGNRHVLRKHKIRKTYKEKAHSVQGGYTGHKCFI